MSCAFRVLAHDFLQSVGLNRGQRSIVPLQEAREPISKPCLAPHVDLGLERIEARGAPRPHGRIIPPSARTAIHARAIVEYEDPPARRAMVIRKAARTDLPEPGH